jgi:hypothetical protein
MSQIEKSPTTGQSYYSGDYKVIAAILSSIKIGDGKTVSMQREDVNRYQERADREIDGMLSDLYHVPFRPRYVRSRDGGYALSFPGDLAQAAAYYTAALIIMQEYQGIASNTNDQVQGLITKSDGMLFNLKRNSHWIPGAERKSHVSRTMPTSWQPAFTPQMQ